MAGVCPRSYSSTSQALFRIFIQPSLRPTTSTSPRLRIPRPQHTCRRHINRYAGASGTFAAPVTPFNDPSKPLDEKINTRIVHYVDEQDGMQGEQLLANMLKTINRKEEHLQQVGKHGQTGLPIVRIRTKRWLRENEMVKEAQKKAQAKTQAAGKELELSWSITRDNDLEHRLKKMEEWLGEGKNVEILIGQKRGGRKASDDEAEELVEIVRNRALAVSGAHEAGDMVGTIGGQAILKFLAKEEQTKGKSTAQAMRQDRQDKMKKKEEEKAKKRADAEEKKRKAEERQREKMEHLKQRAANG